MVTCGTLYIVATPIGNRADLSERARQVLAEVDLIAAEDTRHSGQFLAQLGIKKPLFSLHDHNEADKASVLLEKLQTGLNIALVSDAGTPLVSDPGYRLVAAVGEAGLSVVPIPGACAAIAALSVAGLATDRFVFEGFLPSRSVARRARLDALVAETRTLVFYEAPHRIVECLQEMGAVLGVERRAVLARELTKLHESIYRGSLGGLAVQAAADSNMTRGEAVLVVAGAPEAPAGAESGNRQVDKLLTTLLLHVPLSQAVDLTVEISGERRNRVYDRALALKNAV